VIGPRQGEAAVSDDDPIVDAMLGAMASVRRVRNSDSAAPSAAVDYAAAVALYLRATEGARRLFEVCDDGELLLALRFAARVSALLGASQNRPAAVAPSACNQVAAPVAPWFEKSR